MNRPRAPGLVRVSSLASIIASIVVAATGCSKREAPPSIAPDPAPSHAPTPVEHAPELVACDVDADCLGGTCKQRACVPRVVVAGPDFSELALSGAALLAIRGKSNGVSVRGDDLVSIDVTTGAIAIVHPCAHGCWGLQTAGGAVYFRISVPPRPTDPIFDAELRVGSGSAWRTHGAPEGEWDPDVRPTLAGTWIYDDTIVGRTTVIHRHPLGALGTHETLWSGPALGERAILRFGFGHTVLWDERETLWSIEAHGPARALVTIPYRSVPHPDGKATKDDACWTIDAVGHDGVVASRGTLSKPIDVSGTCDRASSTRKEFIPFDGTGHVGVAPEAAAVRWAASRDGDAFVGDDDHDARVWIWRPGRSLQSVSMPAEGCVLGDRLYCLLYDVLAPGERMASPRRKMRSGVVEVPLQR